MLIGAISHLKMLSKGCKDKDKDLVNSITNLNMKLRTTTGWTLQGPVLMVEDSMVDHKEICIKTWKDLAEAAIQQLEEKEQDRWQQKSGKMVFESNLK